MATQFKVSGELTLSGQQFVSAAKEAKAAIEGVDQAGRKLADTSTTVSAATSQASESQRRKTQYDLDGAKAVSVAEATAKSQAGTLGAVSKAATTTHGTIAGLRAANEDLGKSVDSAGTKLSTFQKTQLSYQLNDVFTSLAGGMGVLRTAVQQGPQITQIFGGLGNTIRAIPAGAIATVAVLGTLAAVLGGAASSAIESAERQRQFRIELTATGNAAGTTAEKLEQLVRTEALRPGAGRADTAAAAGGLLLNNGLDEQALARTLALARDYARITGQDLPSAAAGLSKALDGSSASARTLDQQFNFLSASELEQIRKLEQQGDKGTVVATVLTAMERNFKGANERGISPTTKSLNDLSAAWTKFETSLGNSAIVSKLLSGTGQALSGWASIINGSVPGGGTSQTVADVAALRAELVAAQKAVNDLRTIDISKVINPADVQRQIAQSQKVVEDLRAKIGEAERSATASVFSVGGAGSAAQGAIVRDTEDLKRFTDQLEKLNTVSQQRARLDAEAGDIRGKISGGNLSPDQLSASNERLKTIQGTLYSLGTPAELLQRKLDLEGKLAALPPYLRAAQQAYDETNKAARTAGDTAAEAEKKADQARSNALATQSSATQQQISLLTAQAQGALAVADAYEKSRAAGIRAAAEQAAAQAEQSGAIAPGQAGAYAQQTLEETAASAIAAAAEKNEAYGRETAALGRLVDAEAKGSAAAREAERANKVATVAEDLRAQAAATGSAAIVAAAEKQIAAYDALSKKELAANVRRDAQNLNTQYDPTVAYDLETKKLQELQATGLLTARTVEEYTKQSEQRRLEASRDATDGMIAGLRRYADEATNAGAAAADGVKQGFQTMEDALVQFVTTGKISVGDLANSIIADFARVAIRNVTGPLASGLSSVLGSVVGSLFGGGASGGGAAAPHTGGLVANLPASRAIDPAWYVGAPRYHGGGIVGLRPDERPAILTQNEEVITSSDPRHRWNLGAGSSYGGGMGAAPIVNLNFANNGPPMNARQGQTTPDGRGGWNIDLVLDLVDDGMAQRASNGRGKFMGVLAGSYGVRKQPRR